MQGQVHHRVPGEEGQHVIEERDPGPDAGPAGTVKVECQCNTRFAGNAFYFGPTRFHPPIKRCFCEETKRKSFRNERILTLPPAVMTVLPF
jgi:hypothetical protein